MAVRRPTRQGQLHHRFLERHLIGARPWNRVLRRTSGDLELELVPALQHPTHAVQREALIEIAERKRTRHRLIVQRHPRAIGRNVDELEERMALHSQHPALDRDARVAENGAWSIGSAKNRRAVSGRADLYLRSGTAGGELVATGGARSYQHHV